MKRLADNIKCLFHFFSIVVFLIFNSKQTNRKEHQDVSQYLAVVTKAHLCRCVHTHPVPSACAPNPSQTCQGSRACLGQCWVWSRWDSKAQWYQHRVWLLDWSWFTPKHRDTGTLCRHLSPFAACVLSQRARVRKEIKRTHFFLLLLEERFQECCHQLHATVLISHSYTECHFFTINYLCSIFSYFIF